MIYTFLDKGYKYTHDNRIPHTEADYQWKF